MFEVSARVEELVQWFALSPGGSSVSMRICFHYASASSHFAWPLRRKYICSPMPTYVDTGLISYTHICTKKSNCHIACAMVFAQTRSYIHIQTYMYIYLYVYINIYLHVHMYTYICILFGKRSINRCLHMYTTDIYTYVYTCICMYIDHYLYSHIYM